MDGQLKRGIFAVLTANVISVIFSLLTNFLLPKYLSYDSYANIKTYQLYASYVGLLHFGYVDGIYLKYGGRTLEKKVSGEFSTSLSTMRVFEILVTSATLAVALVLKDPILVFFALSVFPENVTAFFKFLFQATGEFSLYGRVINLTTFAIFAVNMVLLFLLRTDDPFRYIGMYVLASYAIWMTLEVHFHTHHQVERGRLFCVSDLKENVREGFLLTLGNLASMMLTSMDRFFVKFLMTSVDFAQYSFAVSVQNFLILAVTPVTTTLYNYFCRQKDEKSYERVFRYVLVFATLLPAAAFPVKFILEVFLDRYMDASAVVFLLFSAQIFSIIINSVFVNLYKVMRRQKTYFVRLVAVLVTGFVFNVVCYQVVHVKEAFAAGTLLSTFVWFIICRRDFPFLHISGKEYAYIFLEAGIFLGLGLCLPALPGLLLYLAATGILLFALMRETLRGLAREGKSVIRKVLRR